MSLARAQKDTQEAFMRYTTCRDIEQQAKMAVAAAEKRRDDISECLLDSSCSTLTGKISGSIADKGSR